MKKSACFLLVAALAGCASVPKSKFDAIDAQAAKVLRGAGTLSVEVLPGKGLEHYTGAETAMMTAGMLFGAIGGAVGAVSAINSAKRRGTELATATGLTDPSQAVAQNMRQRLPAERLTVNGAETRLVMTTSHWAKNQGNLGYHVQMQMIDAGSSRVMTKGECKFARDTKAAGVSDEALLAESAAMLKQEYDRAAEHCADYFMGELFPSS